MNEDKVPIHSVHVSCGRKFLTMDVPTYLGSDAAQRRALYCVAAKYRWPLEKIKTRLATEDEIKRSK